jgi:hypothetical protein
VSTICYDQLFCLADFGSVFYFNFFILFFLVWGWIDNFGSFFPVIPRFKIEIILGP